MIKKLYLRDIKELLKKIILNKFINQNDTKKIFEYIYKNKDYTFDMKKNISN